MMQLRQLKMLTYATCYVTLPDTLLLPHAATRYMLHATCYMLVTAMMYATLPHYYVITLIDAG
jgi:hypothetical protein